MSVEMTMKEILIKVFYSLFFEGKYPTKNHARITTSMIANAPITIGKFTDPVCTGIGVGIGVPVKRSVSEPAWGSPLRWTGVSVGAFCSMIGRFTMMVMVAVTC